MTSSHPVLRSRRVLACLAAGGLLLTLGACTKSQGVKDDAVKLPAGELSTLVPQPAEVPNGMGAVLAQSGPADIEKLAGFSGDPAAARTSLAKHGFSIGYVVEYADATNGQTITVVASRFATALGATYDLAGDLAAKLPADAATILVPPVGDQSGGVSQPLPNGPTGSQLVTVRFRVANTTWLVAVGSNGQVDPAAVTGIASNLAARALHDVSPSATPTS